MQPNGDTRQLTISNSFCSTSLSISSRSFSPFSLFILSHFKTLNMGTCKAVAQTVFHSSESQSLSNPTGKSSFPRILPSNSSTCSMHENPPYSIENAPPNSRSGISLSQPRHQEKNTMLLSSQIISSPFEDPIPSLNDAALHNGPLRKTPLLHRYPPS